MMILLAALSRLLPHPPNFTPIAGMSLFGAAYFSKKYWAFIIPMLAMLISDLIINNVVYASESFMVFHSTSLYIYLSFALITLLGFRLLKKVSTTRLLGASLASSALFFLITNFGVWAVGYSNFSANFGGLIATYVAGIPFALNTIAGDLFYVSILFGSYELLRTRFPQLSTTTELEEDYV